jgi:hypothetical protein
MRSPVRVTLTAFLYTLLLVTCSTGQAGELRQVVSREHPAIQGTGQGLAVGRDGQVYVAGVYDQGGYVLRISRDGMQKFGATTTYAITGVAGRADGMFATSNAHFAKSVSLYDKQGRELRKVGGFTGNDDVGWDGPGTLEVGASGDFFALDQHVQRVVRVNAAAEIVRSYPLPKASTLAPHRLWTYGFRVHEAAEQFYFVVGPEIQCWGYDGMKRWDIPASVAGDPWGGFSGGFDVDDTGRLYVNSGTDSLVRIYDRDGKPGGEVTLQMGERTADPQRRISHLRVFADDIIVRQKSDTEIFQVYERSTGKLRRVVAIEHEQLTVTCPTPIWTAGTRIPFAIRFNAPGRAVRPQFHSWMRPLGSVRFAELPVEQESVWVPAEASGLYQLRVGSGLEGGRSEYQVETVVEIRPADPVGSVSIFTPLNRRSYRRGEVIPVAIRCRTKDTTPLPAALELELVNAAGQVLQREQVAIQKPADQLTQCRIDPRVTAELPPGEYRLTTKLAGWTIAGQILSIGAGRDPGAARPFYRVRHGDYTMAFPPTTFFDAPEQIARHVEFTKKLGENLMVDRLGHGGGGGLGELPTMLRDPDLIARLQGDPIAVAPEKAEFENRVLQTIAGYGSAGIEQRAILLYMDAGLPIGTGFDKRPPEEMARDIQLVTKRLADYPAFGGWSWAANWWIDKRGADAAANPAEKEAYQAALKQAQETGRWDGVLDTVSNRWIEHALNAERHFRTAMQAANSAKLVSAMTAPYRQPGILPPLSFAQADEVDLHFQAEQIQWPMISAHNVDFYKRPDRPAWGHPELWNDDGTGGQILSAGMQMVMRGADGFGQSGTTKGFASPESDPRGMGPGATSVHRQLNTWLAAHGPWLASLEARDPIAIPVSTRMMRLELGWQGVGGFYFTRLFEAYNACLRAHRPASFVFTEDCQPESFSRFQAVLAVSQTVDWDPQLRAALHSAVKAGVPVFADKSCRKDLLEEFAPRLVDRGFTRIEREPHVLNDDSAFWQFRGIMLEHAQALREAWKDVVPPVAQCDQPEVLLTERRLGDVSVLWAVNDAAVSLEPGHLWRVSLATGSRMPVLTKLDWPAAQGRDVYELISRQRIDATGALTVDLRHAPARVFVALPKAERSGSLAERIPAIGIPPTGTEFGSRIRDLVVSPDNRQALVTVAGWDRNLMLIDPKSGNVVRQDKVGHHFAYAPLATPNGFAVQGYDLNSPEGYHLYLLNSAGSASGPIADKRVALFGLPKRGTSWAVARQWQEPLNSFAVSPDDSWIATAGDLGLAVWSRDGQRLWSNDWSATKRERRRLLAADPRTLIAYDGFTATAHQAQTGAPIWSHTLGETGTLTGGTASADGAVVVLRSTANGGRLFVLRGSQLVNSIATPADDFALSADGRFAAVTWRDELRMYDTTGGLLWTAVADDVLRSPRFNRVGRRVAVGSELGTLLIYDVSGQKVLERDMEALPVAAWLDDGGLLVGTWAGGMSRWDADFKSTWSKTLHSDADPAAVNLLAVDATPTIRSMGWGNAAPRPAPLTPNLLTQTQALIEARCEPTTHGDPRNWQHKVDLLRDGDPTPPDKPWLEWTDISYLDSGWRQKLVVQVDTFRSQIRLRGVTIVEDARHPESWTRDTRLQWWDAAAETWRDGPYLLFEGNDVSQDAATVTHTHWFDTPLEGVKFRFVSTGGASWPVGNLRWGELVLHGEVLGPSHPDAVANRPVAVLFDEKEDVLKNLMAYGDYPFAFRYDDAAAGGKCLSLTRAGTTTAHWRPPFGYVLPNWDFEIVEHPERPGQYRWLEFAWKAASSDTRGVTLRVGPHHGAGVALSAGEATAFESAIAIEQSPRPPERWETVRVDLWKLHGQPFSIRSLSLGSVGGGALFDRLRLGRTEMDLMD